MVDHSLLPWRLLCRKYCAHLAYSPMIHSVNFSQSATFRKIYFQICPEDRPLVVQFCGNDPVTLLKAAKHVEANCDAVDINFGCPQRIAKRGNYGSFLIDGDWNLVYQLVNILHVNLAVPVICKIRILPSIEKTLDFCRMLQQAGCQVLCVHGRTKEQKGSNTGLANWDVIKKIRETVTIPVVSNGNILEFSDLERCLNYTGVNGIMVGEALLKNPAFFANIKFPAFQIVAEYLELCEKYPCDTRFIKHHIQKLLRQDLDHYTPLKTKIARAKHISEIYAAIDHLKDNIANNKPWIQEEEVTSTNTKDDQEDIVLDLIEDRSGNDNLVNL